jgi:small subunit ribosomal protein S20
VAHTLSAIKRIKQSQKRRARNKAEKSKLRTSVKKYNVAIDKADAMSAEELLKASVKAVYKASSKNVIHKRQAARRVSRMTKKLNALKAAK